MASLTVPAADEWLFSPEEMRDSPSREHGVDEATESFYRRVMGWFILECGKAGSMNVVVSSTAVLYFNRFFCLESFKTHKRWEVAYACMFLAGKVEEQPKKLHRLLEVCLRVRRDRLQLEQGTQLPLTDVNSPEFKLLRKKVLECEERVLHATAFSFTVDHSHSHAMTACMVAQGTALDMKWLKNLVMKYTNDSLKTSLCVQYSPQVIGKGMAFLGILSCEEGQKATPPGGGSWLEALELTRSQAESISQQTVEMYDAITEERVCKQLYVLIPYLERHGFMTPQPPIPESERKWGWVSRSRQKKPSHQQQNRHPSGRPVPPPPSHPKNAHGAHSSHAQGGVKRTSGGDVKPSLDKALSHPRSSQGAASTNANVGAKPSSSQQQQQKHVPAVAGGGGKPRFSPSGRPIPPPPSSSPPRKRPASTMSGTAPPAPPGAPTANGPVTKKRIPPPPPPSHPPTSTPSTSTSSGAPGAKRKVPPPPPPTNPPTSTPSQQQGAKRKIPPPPPPPMSPCTPAVYMNGDKHVAASTNGHNGVNGHDHDSFKSEEHENGDGGGKRLKVSPGPPVS